MKTHTRKHHIAHLASAYWNSGAALISTAAFLFSCTSLAVKLNHGALPTFELVLLPGIFCFLATTVIVLVYSMNIRSKSWRVTVLTLLRGLLGAASITCFYLAIELLPLQDAVTLFFCSPVVAALLELVVTGESHGWAGAAATCCTVLGVVLVSQPECIFRHHQPHEHGVAPGSGTSAVGVVLATCAAVANAAAFVVVRLLDRAQSTWILTWHYHGVVVLVSAVPLALRFPAPAVLPLPRGWLVLAAVGGTQFCGQLLLNRGFQLESATRGAAINVLQVLFSFVWDVAVLGDKPGLISMAGSSLVAAGVVFMAATGKPPAAPAQMERSDPDIEDYVPPAALTVTAAPTGSGRHAAAAAVAGSDASCSSLSVPITVSRHGSSSLEAYSGGQLGADAAASVPAYGCTVPAPPAAAAAAAAAVPLCLSATSTVAGAGAASLAAEAAQPAGEVGTRAAAGTGPAAVLPPKGGGVSQDSWLWMRRGLAGSSGGGARNSSGGGGGGGGGSSGEGSTGGTRRRTSTSGPDGGELRQPLLGCPSGSVELR